MERMWPLFDFLRSLKHQKSIPISWSSILPSPLLPSLFLPLSGCCENPGKLTPLPGIGLLGRIARRSACNLAATGVGLSRREGVFFGSSSCNRSCSRVSSDGGAARPRVDPGEFCGASEGVGV